MKQLFIGLLILAAGAGVYYFLQKKNSEKNKSVDKELLLGKWKVDSLYVSPKDSGNLAALILLKDSGFRKFRYDFREGGTFLQTHDDAKVDTSYYEWEKNERLRIKDSKTDSASETYSVNKLNTDSLVLQSKDSAVFVLKKIK